MSNEQSKINFEKEKLLPEFAKFDEEEIAYRRGYHQGFASAKRSTVTEKEVHDWRHGNEECAPPGSPFAGMKMPCVKQKI